MELVDEIRIDPMRGAKRLVDEYRTRLFCVAYRLCSNASDAEDLVFRTFQRAVERIDLCRKPDKVFAWLYSIMVNFWRMGARRKMANAIDFMPELPDMPDDGPDAAKTLEVAEDTSCIRNALQRLPSYYREVVVFRYFEDLSISEIAEVLGMSEGTVKSRLNRAKRCLRVILSGTIPPHPSSNGIGGTH